MTPASRAVFDTPIRCSAQQLGQWLQTRFPVLVVFERAGCEPCRGLTPILERVAEEFVDRIRVVRVTDTDPETARRYGVDRLPTLMFWHHGRERSRIIGAAPAAPIREHVVYVVGEGPRPEEAAGPSVALAPAVGAAGEATGAVGGASGTGSIHSEPIAGTDADFELLVVRSPLPVLVDFWAPWCPPCRAMAPILEDLARRYAGRARVVKVNTDEQARWAGRLRITGLPTFLVYRDGLEIDRLVGAVGGAKLEQALLAAL